MKQKKKKSRVKNWLINIFLLLLLVAGLGLVFNEQIKNKLIETNGEKYSVAKVTPKEIEENKAKYAPFDFDAVQPASTEAVIRAQLSNKRLPVIGGVAVPTVGINLPIFKGLSNEGLLWGAGTLFPDQVMGEGNYALASHRAFEPGLLFFLPSMGKILGNQEPKHIQQKENYFQQVIHFEKSFSVLRL